MDTNPNILLIDTVHMSIEGLSGESREELEVARNQLRRKLLRLHTRLRHLDNPLIVLNILQKQSERMIRFSKSRNQNPS